MFVGWTQVSCLVIFSQNTLLSSLRSQHWNSGIKNSGKQGCEGLSLVLYLTTFRLKLCSWLEPVESFYYKIISIEEHRGIGEELCPDMKEKDKLWISAQWYPFMESVFSGSFLVWRSWTPSELLSLSDSWWLLSVFAFFSAPVANFRKFSK